MSFANPQMRQIKFINMIVARTVAVMANVSLAWLVARHTKKVLQPYKRILAITIFMDLAVSISVVLFQTTSISTNGIYFNLIDDISLGYYLPLYVTHFGTTLVIFFVYCSISIIPLHYIYRYLAICHNRRLTYFQLGCLCCCCCIFPGGMMWFRTVALWPDNSYDYYQSVLFKSNQWLFVDGKVPRFLAAPTERYAMPAIIPGCFYAVTYLICDGIKASCGLKELQISMSSKTLQLQKQMNKILFVQATIPFITNVIPMILVNLGQWLQTPIFPQSDIPVWFLTVWSSAINPICTMFLMSSYRKVIFTMFGGAPTTTSKVSVIPIPTTFGNAVSK